jgi:hypothetical protein
MMKLLIFTLLIALSCALSPENSNKEINRFLSKHTQGNCSSMKINGSTYYCPPGTSNISIYNGSMTCDGEPAKTYCDTGNSLKALLKSEEPNEP